jgi:hypothetical protein
VVLEGSWGVVGQDHLMDMGWVGAVAVFGLGLTVWVVGFAVVGWLCHRGEG